MNWADSVTNPLGADAPSGIGLTSWVDEVHSTTVFELSCLFSVKELFDDALMTDITNSGQIEPIVQSRLRRRASELADAMEQKAKELREMYQ